MCSGSKADRTVSAMRINPLALAVYAVLAFIFATFDGLAGPLSDLIALGVPILVLTSILHLFLSNHWFRFHQNFSSDHPRKGQTVEYALSFSNESVVPLAQGVCVFSNPGPLDSFSSSVAIPSGSLQSGEYRAEIRCSYRGTYIVGLSSYRFTDVLGILTLETRIEPRVFYVYPELVQLDSSVERLARSSGADRPGSSALDEDPSIFEYLAPLRAGIPSTRIAWKRWAATGTPSRIVSGKSRSTALRVFLDLWQGPRNTLEKLASEDMAVSAAFSVLQYLSQSRIPAELVLGNREQGIRIDNPEDFTRVFDLSTNIIFMETEFPDRAFGNSTSTLLITTRPLVGSVGGAELDLFTAFEEALPANRAPHLLACPGPIAAERERATVEALLELQKACGTKQLAALADPAQGIEDIRHALCVPS